MNYRHRYGGMSAGKHGYTAWNNGWCGAILSRHVSIVKGYLTDTSGYDESH
ncbi:unnamed protein product [marine sediment metagenome]|uniref:Uncharacterized protein n=1 Tax=marine sediment metagenome TaxID=412755 RepID=X0XHW6_9ZZZZ